MILLCLFNAWLPSVACTKTVFKRPVPLDLRNVENTVPDNGINQRTGERPRNTGPKHAEQQHTAAQAR